MRIVALDKVVKVRVSAVFPVQRRDDSGASAGAGMAVFAVNGGVARLVPASAAREWGRRVGPERSLPGASVIVYPPASVSDGARVKIRKA